MSEERYCSTYHAMTRAHRSRLTINELAVTQSHRDAMLMSYTVEVPGI